MTSKTVKSGSGYAIEIVDDADWLELTGGSDISLRMWSGSKPLAIRYLWQHGKIEESRGKATLVLHEGIGSDEFRPTALTMMMNDPKNAPAFDRHINGKRCYSIQLVALPRTWYDKLRRDMNGDAKTVFEAIRIEANGGIIEAPPAIIEPDPIEAFIPTPIEEPIEEPVSTLPLDIEIASQVAMSLLTTVVEIIAAGTPETANAKVRQLESDLAGVMQKLSARLEDNERLRRQVRELGEEIQALRFERDGLRNRLRNTESNLSMALRGDAAAAVNGEIQKRVDRIMREAPKAKGD